MRSNPFRTLLTSATAILGLLAAGAVVAVSAPTPAAAAALKEISNFGDNPTSLKMFVYQPNVTVQRPPIVVAVHYCHGDATAFYNGSEFGRLADQYGFLLIFPSVTQASDGCFDVASSATLSHGAGGDSLGIVSMVKYAVSHLNGDPNRVYATGVSSGAMMTNVLLGSYPDVFRAGSAFAGVPFGCFAGPTSWSDDCARGRITRTAEQWGDLVRAAYPQYSGPRPRIQLWHGTSDEVLSYVNFGEAIKQWTDVHGISQVPTSTEPNTPQANWTRTRYADRAGTVLVEAVSMAGTPHNLPVQAAAAIAFFGLDTPVPSGSSKPAGSPAAPGTCTATVSTGSRWATGFVVTVTVTAGGSAISGWQVELGLAEGTTIGSLWNGQSVGTSGTVTVGNAPHNGSLAAGSSTSFGFQGSGSDDAVTASCLVR